METVVTGLPVLAWDDSTLKETELGVVAVCNGGAATEVTKETAGVVKRGVLDVRPENVGVQLLVHT